MSLTALYLLVALGAGLVAMFLRLPPLVGFLAAGFGLHAAGVGELEGLHTLADLGVTLLLFGIGLKLDVRSLLRPDVWLSTFAHLGLSILIGVGLLAGIAPLGFALLTDADLGEMALIAFVLSFSSTVFAIKVLDERHDNNTLYGRIAIGVLVMQDIVAVVFLTISKGHWPSPWVFALVLLLPGAWLAHRVWDRITSAELTALFGLAIALVPGYWLFDAVGLKGDLGALVVGVLLGSHAKAPGLAKLLFSTKELLLIAFFLSIGLTGVPSLEDLALASILQILLPLQAAAYVVIFAFMGLRYRTATLASFSLTNYSEFGLIVIVIAAATGMASAEWQTVLAVATSLSFLVAALFNAYAPKLINLLNRVLPTQNPKRLQEADRPINLGDAKALVVGMGRVGRTTYEELRDAQGYKVLAIEHDSLRAESLKAEGFDVVEADATDQDFWERVKKGAGMELVVLTMPFHGDNLLAMDLLRKLGFTGTVAAIALRPEERDELKKRGAHAVLNLYASAGSDLAEKAIRVNQERQVATTA
ncbi:MAG: cation:proton antiporter [Nocardioides sp.]|uniref:cation:proton antiporter domain-containing protein n=1 Tax=Nocardioides sp. TaxID=35761 RepID=UPI003D6B9646